MYGTQAISQNVLQRCMFENDVKMYGTQAQKKQMTMKEMFENDVKMYGTQAVYEPAMMYIRV